MLVCVLVCVGGEEGKGRGKEGEGGFVCVSVSACISQTKETFNFLLVFFYSFISLSLQVKVSHAVILRLMRSMNNAPVRQNSTAKTLIGGRSGDSYYDTNKGNKSKLLLSECSPNLS